MSQKSSAEVARFIGVDVHDDTVESIAFFPPTSKRGTAKLQITLNRHWRQRRRMLEFVGCSNLELAVDADVLKDNAPNNTAGVTASADRARVIRLIKSHQRKWGVRYAPPINPMAEKLKGANSLAIFQVQFFGGKLEVVARSYRLRHLTTRLSGP